MKFKDYLKPIFSITNDLNRRHKVITLFGFIKFKLKLNPIDDIVRGGRDRIINELKVVVYAQNLHSKVFPKYKNINYGREVVLVATGPSLNDYIPIDGAIHVGVNRAFMCDKICLDYLFMQDYLAVKDYIEESFNYKNKNLKRFYGIMQSELVDNWVIPESCAIRHSAERYYACSPWDPKSSKYSYDYTYDIASLPLVCHGTVAFTAMQFILYTNPAKIYLVGCDCSNNGYFNGPPMFQMEPKRIRYYWNKLKYFANMYYPETEIISVNPVGLKGLFKDIYQ